jgi:hypothetical protein
MQPHVAHYLLLQAVKDSYVVPSAPVVTFGGSYGGKLAAWMRARFPSVVYAAVASRAHP